MGWTYDNRNELCIWYLHRCDVLEMQIAWKSHLLIPISRIASLLLYEAEPPCPRAAKHTLMRCSFSLISINSGLFAGAVDVVDYIEDTTSFLSLSS